MVSLSELIHLYFGMGVTYKDMQRQLASCHGIAISLRQLKRTLAVMQLRRRQYSDVADVVAFVADQINKSGTLCGYRWMYHKCQESGINCRREHVRIILNYLDPASVQFRRARRLHRRKYFARGPNFIWHIDSYDKLKPFGICINGGIDGYSRKVLWLNCYYTSSNPLVVASYYVETVSKLQCCPKLVRTDDGTENVDILDMQKFLRRNGLDCLAGSRSAMTGTSTHNQRIESWWGILRKECVEFWLVLFHNLKNWGDFDGGYLDRNILQFCFMAVIQDELDDVLETWNDHYIRRSRNVSVPSGRPNIMYSCPLLYGAEDECCAVDTTDLDICKQHCIFRTLQPCEDEDVYNLCLTLMMQHNLSLPNDPSCGVELYRKLRMEIMALL